MQEELSIDPVKLIGERVLIKKRESGMFFDDRIYEVSIVEVSPSGTYICIREADGNVKWLHNEDIIILEVLK